MKKKISKLWEKHVKGNYAYMDEFELACEEAMKLQREACARVAYNCIINDIDGEETMDKISNAEVE